MRLLTRILPLAVVAASLPGSAAAKPRTTVAPPGASGITQYLEVVPSAAGPTPPGPVASDGHGSALTDGQRRQLDGLGPDGRKLAAVVDATAPQSPGPSGASPPATAAGRAGSQAGGGPEVAGGSGTAAKLPPQTGGSPASLILDAVGGREGAGFGALLPVFMLTSALVAAAYGLWRRRMRL